MGPAGAGQGGVQGPGHTRLLLSAVQVDKEDVLIRAVAGSGLLEVTDAGAAHSCWGRRGRRGRAGSAGEASTFLTSAQGSHIPHAWLPLTAQEALLAYCSLCELVL